MARVTSTEDAVARVRVAAATKQEVRILKKDIWMVAIIKERRSMMACQTYM